VLWILYTSTQFAYAPNTWIERRREEEEEERKEGRKREKKVSACHWAWLPGTDNEERKK